MQMCQMRKPGPGEEIRASRCRLAQGRAASLLGAGDTGNVSCLGLPSHHRWETRLLVSGLGDEQGEGGRVLGATTLVRLPAFPRAGSLVSAFSTGMRNLRAPADKIRSG